MERGLEKAPAESLLSLSWVVVQTEGYSPMGLHDSAAHVMHQETMLSTAHAYVDPDAQVRPSITLYLSLR